MAIEIPTHLVRYGDYNWQTGILTEEGHTQVDAACDTLVARGVGHSALVFSITHRPARTTTEKIIERTGAQTVIDVQARNDLSLVSRHPAELDVGVEQFLEEVITDAGHDLSMHDGLVVVTRARLIGAMRGMSNWATANRTIPHGHVEEYQPGTWPPLPPGGYPY